MHVESSLQPCMRKQGQRQCTGLQLHGPTDPEGGTDCVSHTSVDGFGWQHVDVRWGWHAAGLQQHCLGALPQSNLLKAKARCWNHSSLPRQGLSSR